MRWQNLLALVVFHSGLIACTTPQTGLLGIAPPADNTDRIALIAATTRAPVDNPGMLFGGDRGDAVAYSRIVVSIPRDRKAGTVQLPRQMPGDAKRDFVATAVTSISRNDIANAFRADGAHRRRAFVFVHGYSTTFDRAVFRFAQLVHDSDAKAVPILFSWPSRGQFLDYKRDFDNASYSRSDLANLLEASIASPSIDEVVVLAHSMGAWLAVEALRQVALKRGGVPAKVTSLILASPDLDVGVFRRQVEDMGPRRPKITIFVARNDRALQLSQFISRGGARLGRIDLSQEKYRQALSDLKGITVLDLSALSLGDRVNHALYATSPEAVRLIGDRLLQGQVITDADVSRPAVAIDALGAAATFVVTTPILIFDTASGTRH
ncbi:alpha/beta hydrolase [Neorhizobium alkalisoli]|uniref:Esterase/lipase superfamily enzyme n=1 Tax=Neorhizobium alkalisoli TaxID=528178 RepID=A0A561QAM3_9HYPH|nr:alpha/beta fold hydrolase [Neorhizobium alkalisoli]TWF47381.1 esterase/lipase superfamily enzyme [Neorhizobium alkalisoli]